MTCPRCKNEATKNWLIQSWYWHCSVCKDDITKLLPNKGVHYNKAWFYSNPQLIPYVELFFTTPMDRMLFEVVYKTDQLYFYGYKPQIWHKEGIDFLIDWVENKCYYINETNKRVDLASEKVN